MADELDSPFSWTVRVYYEDTDVSGVVYHANYLRFFERARTEWLRSLGFDQERLMQEQKIAFTVASLEVDFRIPARLDDELAVSVAVIRCGRASMQLKQEMRSMTADKALISTLSCRVGSVDAVSFRPTAMPELITKEIKHVS